jgi:hypothetical protein
LTGADRSQSHLHRPHARRRTSQAGWYAHGQLLFLSFKARPCTRGVRGVEAVELLSQLREQAAPELSFLCAPGAPNDNLESALGNNVATAQKRRGLPLPSGFLLQ